MTIAWNSGMRLLCPACGWTCRPGPYWRGCGRCRQPLLTWYPDDDEICLPIDPAQLTDIGHRPTPLVPSPEMPNTWFKLEYCAPTQSHKDRFHAVTSAIARLLRAPGVVTTSSGNHGVSCAAHAARDQLPCIVLTTGNIPPALSSQLSAYGAIVAGLEPAARRKAVAKLVEHGWVPATSTDPSLSGAGNPYGADGYQAIAHEIVDELGLVPAAVSLPAASGDTLLGITRGFDALTRLGQERPLTIACQPAKAAALAHSLLENRQAILPEHASIARSASDPSIGRLAITRARQDAIVITVREDEIRNATQRLARQGFYVEPSSALALAGLERARQLGAIDSSRPAVALLTATGRGWTETAHWLHPRTPSVSTIDDVLKLAAEPDQALTTAKR